MNKYYLKSSAYKTIEKSKNLFSSSFFNYLGDNGILLYYSDFNKNWGDYINPFLLKSLTGKEVISRKRIFNVLGKEQIIGIGSILNTDLNNSVIWGSGYIEVPKKVKGIPNQVLALRGKYTSKILKDAGINDSGVYGDPALLYPEIYYPEGEKEYKLGVIPHYSELHYFDNAKFKNNKDVKLISPIVKDNNQNKIIEDLYKCECIISSSLHGLILADAYNIPTARFTLSGKIIGNDFKFNDYYSGVGIQKHETFHIDSVDEMNIPSICNLTSMKDLKFSSQELKDVLLNYLGINELK